MRPSLTPLGPSVSRDRVITSFPKWYTPAACLQLREHFHGQVSAACQRGNTGTVGLRLSKVVVVGDLYVGKTCLIHRFCKNVFNHDYKATIGVDFEIERFEVAGTPFSLQMQWLEDALRENEPGACFLFLVGTKKDLLSGAACEQAEAEAVRLANEMQAEYWSVSAKTGRLQAGVMTVHAHRGEREGIFQPCGRPGLRALSTAGLGAEEQRPAAGRRRGPHPDGGTPTQDPGQQEALQPELLLARPAAEASLPSTRRAGGVSVTWRGRRGAHHAEPQGPPSPSCLLCIARREPGEAPTAARGPGLEGQSHLQCCPSALAAEAQDCRHSTCPLGPRPRAWSGLPGPLPSPPGRPRSPPHLRGPGGWDSLFWPRLFCQQGWASEPRPCGPPSLCHGLAGPLSGR
ncbi:ras-related protein Rab-36 isoform X3 [Odocoileus virginianus]|uniref:Ras-related protein Rab-36 isoform X3 n=1 Tax=Odocoileus virginianus TaxID=9874 RepID=A0ABM4IVF5_ODOVR